MAILGNVTMAGAQHWIFESSRMKATNGAAHLYDAIVAEKDVDNGTALKIGAYTGEGLQTRNATVAAQGDKIAVAGSVANVRDSYSTQSAQPYNFYNKKGAVIRAYEVVAEDIFGVSEEAIDGDITVGATVVWNGEKYAVETGATTNYGFVGKVHSIQKGSFFNLVRIECIQNEQK